MGNLFGFKNSPKDTLNSLFSAEGMESHASVDVCALEEQPFNPTCEECPRFDVADKSAFVDYLKANGFVVIRGVASADEVEHAKGLLWKYLQENSYMRKDDPSTWTNKNFKTGGDAQSGILGGYIGQSKFCWFTRLLPKVKEAFKSIWETDDLLVSFDGGNIFRPWWTQELEERITSSGWFHVDQGSGLPGMHCVQGLLTLTDAHAGTGGIILIPKSHLLHEDLMEATFRRKQNFVRIPNDFHALKGKQLIPKLSAGDLVLWDSRTIHCNSPAIETPTASLEEMLRMVSYICMTPRAWASEEVLKDRVKAFQKGVTTSHWPHRAEYQIPEWPDVNSLSDVSPEQKALIGVRG